MDLMGIAVAVLAGTAYLWYNERREKLWRKAIADRPPPNHSAVIASPEIAEYFSQFTYEPLPETGSKPVEVVWKRVGELAFTGPRLYVGDSWAIAADSIEVPAT